MGAPPLAVRVQSPAGNVAYSGDTPALFHVSRGADLFLVEAYTWEREVHHHLSHLAVADHLAEFGAARVALTHMSPDMLEHVEEACAPTLSDGDRLTV